MICLLRSFLILSTIMRQISWVVWSLQLLLLYFACLCLILHACHMTCWSHPVTWKGGHSEGDQGTLIFFTLRLLCPRKPFGLDIMTSGNVCLCRASTLFFLWAKQWSVVFDKGNCVARQSSLELEVERFQFFMLILLFPKRYKQLVVDR